MEKNEKGEEYLDTKLWFELLFNNFWVIFYWYDIIGAFKLIPGIEKI
jgi:hypothetical protein